MIKLTIKIVFVVGITCNALSVSALNVKSKLYSKADVEALITDYQPCSNEQLKQIHNVQGEIKLFSSEHSYMWSNRHISFSCINGDCSLLVYLNSAPIGRKDISEPPYYYSLNNAKNCIKKQVTKNERAVGYRAEVIIPGEVLLKHGIDKKKRRDIDWTEKSKFGKVYMMSYSKKTQELKLTFDYVRKPPAYDEISYDGLYLHVNYQ